MPVKPVYWIILSGALFVVATLLGGAPEPAEATRVVTPLSAAEDPAGARLILSLPLPESADGQALHQTGGDAGKTAVRWESVTVRPGDSLAKIFSRLGIPARTLQEILALGRQTAVLKRLYPGEALKISRMPEGRLAALQYELDESRMLHVAATPDGFQARVITQDLEVRTAYAVGVIDHSLFAAAQKAGLSDRLTMELAGIFGWDIDFVLDIRHGDRFAVLYEEYYRDGRKLRDGAILAAEFVNQGTVFRAVRYTDPKGRTDYYTPSGESLRKAFLRAPVTFTRISSGFSSRRKHPLLNRIRAHKGVDYAAPRGTPVRATGDGKVIFRGRKGGYGKTIIIQHGTRYRTLYAHLSAFGRGIRLGRRVRQGQVIGYVGATGLATGPHLHYEFQVNGVHRNPLTVKLPAARPVPRRYRNDFQAHASSLLAQLDLVKRTLVAMNRYR